MFYIIFPWNLPAILKRVALRLQSEFCSFVFLFLMIAVEGPKYLNFKMLLFMNNRGCLRLKGEPLL